MQSEMDTCAKSGVLNIFFKITKFGSGTWWYEWPNSGGALQPSTTMTMTVWAHFFMWSMFKEWCRLAHWLFMCWWLWKVHGCLAFWDSSNAKQLVRNFRWGTDDFCVSGLGRSLTVGRCVVIRSHNFLWWSLDWNVAHLNQTASWKRQKG